MLIKELLGKEYLDKFKIIYSSILFEPNWEALKLNRCPLCGNKLKFPRNKEIGFCRSVKHKKSFVISNKRLKEICK